MSLKDKVAIITGAGQGIGAAYARKFCEEGAKVAIADINQQKSEALVKEITANGHEALAVMTDVSDEASTQALIHTVLERYGPKTNFSKSEPEKAHTFYQNISWEK